MPLSYFRFSNLVFLLRKLLNLVLSFNLTVTLSKLYTSSQGTILVCRKSRPELERRIVDLKSLKDKQNSTEFLPSFVNIFSRCGESIVIYQDVIVLLQRVLCR